MNENMDEEVLQENEELNDENDFGDEEEDLEVMNEGFIRSDDSDSDDDLRVRRLFIKNF